MKKVSFKSLTLRIWITFVIFVGIIILAISFIYLVIIRQMNISHQLQNLEDNHEVLVQMFTQSKDFSPSTPPHFELNKERPINHMIVKTDSNNEVLSISTLDRRAVHNAIALHPLANYFLSYLPKDITQESSFSVKGSFNKTQYLFAITPIEDINEQPTIHTYLVSYFVIKNIDTYFSMIIIVGIAFISIALVVSKIISNYISRPLKELEKRTLKIAHKEWVEPVTPTSNDEIGSLINSINFMQHALQQAEQEERRFLQSISHDLKTPIMVIISHAEAIKDGIYIDTLENTADIIKNEALRLESKVKQILYYNTLDYALLNEQEQQDINLFCFTSYLIKRFKTMRPELEWKLSLKPIMVYVNSERLLVALENILDNQIRYAKTFIRIVVRQDDQFAIIHISNDGPSIPEDQLPHIFKNLYKGENGKFGLGLAITYKIITFYGGSITVENINIGVVFKIKIPLSSPLN